MKPQTAVDWLIEQLQAPCKGIPSHIIEDAKQMEENQHIDSYNEGYRDGENDGVSGNNTGKDISEYSNAKLYFHEKYKGI
jgi:hypothetical protein